VKLVNCARSAVGKKRGTLDTFRSVKRRLTRNRLEGCLWICCGNPVPARLVCVLVLFYCEPAHPTSPISRRRGGSGNRLAVLNTGYRSAETFVSYHGDLAAVVQDERAIAKHKILGAVTCASQQANG